MGVGAIKRFSAVRWGVTARILYAWIFTLPGAALIGASLYLLISKLS
jgi:PiT family inorganic phosphate transporter